MREFAFELHLCAALEERCGGRETQGDELIAPRAIVARQLGASVANPGGRILDVVCVEPGPAFDERVALTGREIPDAAIESDVGTGQARYWKTAFGPDVHPERAREVTDRACEIGFFDRERRGGRDYVRQAARYPDWYGSIVGIENKPDLSNPGDLEAQLRTDVSLGLLDEVILATRSYVTRVHLNRIPEEVGVWRFDPDSDSREVDVIREPTRLPVDRSGIELLATAPGRTDVAVVSSEAKARKRRRLAERAYGKGWRTYGIPACGACDPGLERSVEGATESEPTVSETRVTLPYCTWKERVVDASSECGPSCGGYEALGSDEDGDEYESVESDEDEGEGDRDLAAALERERERRTAWIAEPTGPREQSGLDRFL